MTAATQLIPARGRKLRAEADLHGFHRTQLIPARGRKLGCWPRWSGSSPDTTYPREGTETADGARIQARTLDTTYPREGTGRRLWTSASTTLQPQKHDVLHCGKMPFERTQSGTRSRPQEMPSHFSNLVMPTTGGHMGPPLR